MNLQNEVSTIMSKSLKTLTPVDKLQDVKDLFDTYAIHHVPVLDESNKLVGIVSKSDMLYFLKAVNHDNYKAYMNKIRLKNYTVGEVMSTNTVTVQEDEPIQAALEILSDNLFHAVPVMRGEELVGIVTTHDIVYSLLSKARTAAE